MDGGSVMRDYKVLQIIARNARDLGEPLDAVSHDLMIELLDIALALQAWGKEMHDINDLSLGNKRRELAADRCVECFQTVRDLAKSLAAPTPEAT